MSVIKRFGIGLDQAINCLVKLHDGYGLPDEMLSARAWRLREHHPRLHTWIDRVFFWDKDHCQECFEIEMRKEQYPEVYRLAADSTMGSQNNS